MLVTKLRVRERLVVVQSFEPRLPRSITILIGMSKIRKRCFYSINNIL